VDEDGAKSGAGHHLSHGFDVGADGRIARLARRQRGRVTRTQLLSASITVDEIRHRLGSGRLHREHAGVYAVGYRRHGRVGRWQSALLAVGDDGVLSDFVAAARHGFGADPVTVDITCPRKLHTRRGIRLHHRHLPPREVVRLEGLPFTSPSRTLFDLASRLNGSRLAAAANEAFVRRIVTLDELYATAARNRGRRGSVAFRRLLATLDPEGREVRSRLEVRLNSFLRARGFPRWEQNVPLRVAGETIRPDVLWRAQRVVVEADGRDPHLAPLTFDRDRRRDRRLRVDGWQPVRVTSRDLGAGADELEADLRRLLGISATTSEAACRPGP